MVELSQCAAVILCGGKSRRLRADKVLLQQNGRYVLADMVEALRPLFAEVVLATDNEAHLFPVFGGENPPGVRPLEDRYPESGPLGAICTAFEQTTWPYLYVVACDMPVVDKGLIAHMAALCSGDTSVCCRVDGELHPMNAFYARSIYPVLLGQYKSGCFGLWRAFYKARTHFYQPLETEMESFNRNINYFDGFVSIGAPEREWYRMVRQRRYENGVFTECEDAVILEQEVRLVWNGREVFEGPMSPDNLREFAVGHLFCGGYIGGAGDVAAVDWLEDTCTLNITPSPLAQPPVAGVQAGRQQAPAEFAMRPEEILSMMSSFTKASTLFKKTGAVHSAMLCVGGRCYFAEDIGRSNTLDKIIGYALLNGLPLNEATLFTSGRVAKESVEKAAAAGIPLLVSKAAATLAAIETAKQRGVAVVAFARGERFNVY